MQIRPDGLAPLEIDLSRPAFDIADELMRNEISVSRGIAFINDADWISYRTHIEGGWLYDIVRIIAALIEPCKKQGKLEGIDIAADIIRSHIDRSRFDTEEQNAAKAILGELIEREEKIKRQ